MTKDMQKSKVYAAEFTFRWLFEHQPEAPVYNFYGSNIILPVEKKFGDIAAIQRYVDNVLPGEGVTVRPRKGIKFAHYQDREIAIPTMRGSESNPYWAMREIVVLHECAHHLARGAAHGPGFTAQFIALVTEHMGPEAGLLLTDLFRGEEVQT